MTQENEAAREPRAARKSASEYPADRFDEPALTGRIGAHRVTAQPRSGWYFVLGGLVGAALLTTIGILAVSIATSSGSSIPLISDPKPTTTVVKVKPELNPEARVAVLDGTTEEGSVAERVAAEITENSWGSLILASPAATSDVTISAVFYADEAQEAAALALAEKLGGVSSYLNADYAEGDADLVVLIGSDYAGPGKA